MSSTPADGQGASATASPPAGATATSVHVRMYRSLEPDCDTKDKPYKGMLGDCFLIRLGAGTKKSHILIDFGLLLGSPYSTERAGQIAQDIATTCDNSLDLLVVTHEHWDHISGFSQAANVFFDRAKLRIENLWMAWTEDPKDPTANALRDKFEKSGQAFAMIAERLGDATIFGLDAGRALDGLQGFLGMRDNDGNLSGRDILTKLKGQAITQPPSYLAPVRQDRNEPPDNIQTTPGAVSLTAYVLGPPRDWKWLSKDKPSSNPAKQETYLETPTLGMSLLGFAEGDDVLACATSPFAPQYCRRKLQAFTKPDDSVGHPPDDIASQWLIDHYIQPTFGSSGPVPNIKDQGLRKNATAERQKIADRRRIDGDWLASAGALALKLDSDTNNTSLVLAFDLPDGTAMLFAADAQVGNWLSWHNQTYGSDDSGNPRTATSILNRVRFYKVGHHGSHNATLDKEGLALMTHPDLVAAIPTDEELGARQGRGGWQMPNPRVKAALQERTKGRILRNDRHYYPDDPDKRKDIPDLANVPPEFFANVTETPLYLEYRVL